MIHVVFLKKLGRFSISMYHDYSHICMCVPHIKECWYLCTDILICVLTIFLYGAQVLFEPLYHSTWTQYIIIIWLLLLFLKFGIFFKVSLSHHNEMKIKKLKVIILKLIHIVNSHEWKWLDKPKLHFYFLRNINLLKIINCSVNELI